MNQGKKQHADLSELQRMALYIAQVVRDEMEGFYAEHLSDEQMAELDPIVRDAIYTALYAAEQAAQGSREAEMWMNFHNRWPKHWQPPELIDDYTASVALLKEDEEMTELLGQLPQRTRR